MISNKQPAKHGVYGVLHGTYCGETLIYINGDRNNFAFLSLPKNINRVIPKDKFDFGIKESIIEFIETSPKNMWQLFNKQYIFNSKKHK